MNVDHSLLIVTHRLIDIDINMYLRAVMLLLGGAPRPLPNSSMISGLPNACGSWKAEVDERDCMVTLNIKTCLGVGHMLVDPVGDKLLPAARIAAAAERLVCLPVHANPIVNKRKKAELLKFSFTLPSLTLSYFTVWSTLSQYIRLLCITQSSTPA